MPSELNPKKRTGSEIFPGKQHEWDPKETEKDFEDEDFEFEEFEEFVWEEEDDEDFEEEEIIEED
jgi:hypothetical protein